MRWLEEIYIWYLWILRKPLIVFQERWFGGRWREKGCKKEIKAIMKLYTNIETFVMAEYTRLERYDVNIEVHQGLILVLSPLLFALVMDDVTKDIREEVVK